METLGEQVVALLIQRGFSRAASLLALNTKLAKLVKSSFGFQLDWSYVGFNNLAFCLDAGLPRRNVCRVALFNRDLQLLQVARSQGLPFGKLLAGMGPSTAGAAPLIDWAVQQGWQPSLKQVYKLICRTRYFKQDLALTLGDCDFKGFDEFFNDRFQNTVYSKRIAHPHMKLLWMINEFIAIEVGQPGTLGWFVDLVHSGWFVDLVDSMPSTFPVYFRSLVMTVIGLVAKRAVEAHAHRRFRLYDDLKADSMSLIIAMSTGNQTLFNAVLENAERVGGVQVLFDTAVRIGLPAVLLEPLWRSAGGPDANLLWWERLPRNCSINTIQWMRTKGLTWDECLIWRLIELDCPDLLQEIVELGCPIPEKPDCDRYAWGIPVAQVSCPGTLELFMNDPRWTHWRLILPLMSAVDAGRLDWLQLLISLGQPATVQVISRCIQLGRYDMLEPVFQAALKEDLLKKASGYEQLFAWFPHMSADALLLALKDPFARQLVREWIWQNCGEVRWLRSSKCKKEAKLLWEAGLLQHNYALDRGDLPLPWIGDRFDRLEQCIESGLQLYDDDVLHFAKRNHLQVLQQIWALIDRLVADRDLPTIQQWFGISLTFNFGDCDDVDDLSTLANQWIAAIAKLSADRDPAMHQWALSKKIQ